jgi:hypothetical protein
MILSRRLHAIFYTAAVVLLVLAVAPADAQTVIRGTVIEDGTRVPIGTVDLRLLDADGEIRARAISDQNGQFTIELQASDSGVFTLGVRRVGYAPITAEELRVGAGDELVLEIRLSARAVALEAVTVVAQRRFEPNRIIEFRERAQQARRTGLGRIYMREDMDRMGHSSIQFVLDAVPWGNRCRPLVLLDGLPADERLTGVRAGDLEGVEIYRGVTQIPPEYYRYGMCGLALLWTRSDPDGLRPLTWARVAAAAVVIALMALIAR